MKKSWLFIGLVVAALEMAAAPWHYPQYLDHNIPHRQRRAVVITNKGNAASDGEMMFISVKDLGLAGTPSKDIRVVDDNGMELMYAVYWDNPSAWALPDMLKAPLKTFRDSFEDGNEIAPPGWRSAMTDDKHVNARSDTVAHSGGKSVMTTVLEGASPSWVQFGRSFAVQPGSRYVMRCWVKGENIAKLNTTNPLQAMQGQTPGVSIQSTSGQPGSGMKVQIRGLGTVGSSGPLYLIDGIGGDISTLNPASFRNTSACIPNTLLWSYCPNRKRRSSRSITSGSSRARGS